MAITAAGIAHVLQQCLHGAHAAQRIAVASGGCQCGQALERVEAHLAVERPARVLHERQNVLRDDILHHGPRQASGGAAAAVGSQQRGRGFIIVNASMTKS